MNPAMQQQLVKSLWASWERHQADLVYMATYGRSLIQNPDQVQVTTKELIEYARSMQKMMHDNYQASAAQIKLTVSFAKNNMMAPRTKKV